MIFTDACKGPTELIIPDRMTHCTFDYNANLCNPLKSFLKRCGYFESDKLNKEKEKYLFFEDSYFKRPFVLNEQ